MRITRFSNTLDVWLSNLSKTGRSRKQAVTIVIDALIVMFSLWAAYTLRHGAAFVDFQATWYLFVLLPIATVLIFAFLGIYRWVVRSSDGNLIRQLIKASIAASVVLIMLTYLLPPDRTNPRSLFIIFGMVVLISSSGIRYVWRMLFDFGNSGEPVAIYGAGYAGRQVFNSLSKGNEYRPVLFLDDVVGNEHTTISGIPVLSGQCPDTIGELKKLEIGRIILAMPASNAAEYQRKLEAVGSAGIRVQTVPSYSELVTGSTSLSEVRDISISDILGRNEVPPNLDLLGFCVRGKSVLVTGGGGSIGSELCRQILTQDPAKLIIVDHSEENLYKITEEIKQTKIAAAESTVEFVPILRSIIDEIAMNDIMASHDVETVYHAAAYKHVPIVESFPDQGVNVNVFGTLNVLNAALAANVKDFTLISTDKAVRPTNAMGASKRVAELILQAKSKVPGGSTRISMVRFGNVLGSSGSVLPKFKKQIEEGGPITVTHPDITRYFMTIPEAAQLVLQASAIAKGGDVFVLDMGEPVKIVDLATSMVKTMGKKLKQDTNNDHDIDIVFEGLRPGEKMYEEMFVTSACSNTEVAKVFTANEDWLDWTALRYELSELEKYARDFKSDDVRQKLLDLAFMRDIKRPEQVDISAKRISPNRVTQANEIHVGSV